MQILNDYYRETETDRRLDRRVRKSLILQSKELLLKAEEKGDDGEWRLDLAQLASTVDLNSNEFDALCDMHMKRESDVKKYNQKAPEGYELMY